MIIIYGIIQHISLALRFPETRWNKIILGLGGFPMSDTINQESKASN